jgi:hypothetical protein
VEVKVGGADGRRGEREKIKLKKGATNRLLKSPSCMR